MHLRYVSAATSQAASGTPPSQRDKEDECGRDEGSRLAQDREEVDEVADATNEEEEEEVAEADDEEDEDKLRGRGFDEPGVRFDDADLEAELDELEEECTEFRLVRLCCCCRLQTRL